MGYDECTPIQEQAMPLILEGTDLIACAQTGTGKTAAFLLPILHKLANKPADGVNTLIVVPTRELAIQIDQAIQGFAYYVGVESICIYGGGDGMGWDQQKQSLMGGTPIIVATPSHERGIPHEFCHGFWFSVMDNTIVFTWECQFRKNILSVLTIWKQKTAEYTKGLYFFFREVVSKFFGIAMVFFGNQPQGCLGFYL